MQNALRLLLLCASIGFGASAMAQAPRPSDIVTAELRPGWRTASGTIMAALHLRLAPNWITYWRHPGESGIVPQVDLSGSTNLGAARIHWPAPKLFTKAGFLSIGYSDEVILPLELTAQHPDRAISLNATVNIGVCDDVCIPVDLHLNAVLDGRGRPDRTIARALDSRPATAQSAGLSAVHCDLQPAAKGLHLSAHWTIPQRAGQEYILLELPGSAWRVQSLPSERSGTTLIGRAMLRGKQGQTGGIERGNIRMTLITTNGTYVHEGCSLGR
jgi:DsbC/DsbD-like thiol-disulfide interchange protein